MERERKYKSNCTSALLFNQCNKAMQSKIQSRKDYESTVKDDPIELLKAIEEYSVSDQYCGGCDEEFHHLKAARRRISD